MRVCERAIHHWLLVSNGNGLVWSIKTVLGDEADRKVYLDLLRQSTEQHGVAVIGYCLMSNHIHLVAVPRKADVLARTLKETHGRFASYWNALHHSTGHVWQGRYYSCPLDEPHLWEALRYTELNPVRASLVAGTGLINPQVVEMPRMRPAIEAGLMVLLEAADPNMRPVLKQSAGTGPALPLIVVRIRQKHGWRCTCGAVDGPLSLGVPIWMQA
jgi:REP element-mobilizing transposase RayT